MSAQRAKIELHGDVLEVTEGPFQHTVRCILCSWELRYARSADPFDAVSEAFVHVAKEHAGALPRLWEQQRREEAAGT